jgi:hypothetical protein
VSRLLGSCTWRRACTLKISSSVGVTHITSAGPPMQRTAPLCTCQSWFCVISNLFNIPCDGLDVCSCRRHRVCLVYFDTLWVPLYDLFRVMSSGQEAMSGDGRAVTSLCS